MQRVNKAIAFDEAHVKFVGETQGVFEGYASVYDHVDAHGDVIKSGAFEDALRGSRQVAMFFNHDRMGVPVGKWTELHEDGRGLFAKGELTPGNLQSDTIRAAMKHGTVSGLSVGFSVNPAHVEKSDTGLVFSRITRLNEISLCTFPANEQATITALKSMDWIMSLSEAEDWLRDAAGLSRSQATGFIARVKAAIRSESEGTESSEAADKILAMIKNFNPLEKHS